MATGSGDMLPIPSSEDSLTVAGTAVTGTTTPVNASFITATSSERFSTLQILSSSYFRYYPSFQPFQLHFRK
jgi:hypothetical protein